MCLLKLYLDTGSGRKLLAKEIAFITKQDGKVKFSDVQSRENTLDDVEIFEVNAMNSELILKPRR